MFFIYKYMSILYDDERLVDDKNIEIMNLEFQQKFKDEMQQNKNNNFLSEIDSVDNINPFKPENIFNKNN